MLRRRVCVFSVSSCMSEHMQRCKNRLWCHTWVGRRTLLCLERHGWNGEGGCERSVFSGLPYTPTGLHRGPSVAWRTRGAPGARGANKYTVKSVLERCEINRRERHCFLCGTCSLPLTSHALCLFRSLSHIHIDLSFHTHLTWRFTVQINSDSSCGPGLV